jgi:SAM-dependent methyltransferase
MIEARQAVHDMLPEPLHDEGAFQDYVSSIRKHLARNVGPGTHAVYKARVEPAFVKDNGRPPANADEVRGVMTKDPYYQFWSAMQRTSQEMMWDSVIDTVERTLPELIEKAQQPGPLGSLRLAPGFEVPNYHTAYDIHLQPGAYHSDQTEANDVAAGAIYDMGVPIYAVGMMGRENNSTGGTIVNLYKNAYPDKRPLRILDLGCAIGNSTVPWKQAFPDAEVHGVDVAAPCLRYGHARANAMGISIHLSQQNAESLDFEDNSFDVVASALLFHETSRRGVPAIMKEVHRILKPGGVMAHFDGFKSRPTEPIQEFLGQWEVYNNNEYFVKTLRSMDVLGIVKDAGFAEDKVAFRMTPFVTDVRINPPGTKGYMSGFTEVPVLTAEK